MTWRIDKSYWTARGFDAICPNMLSNTALLTAYDMQIQNSIQKRRLTVVDVSKESNDRSSRFEGLRRIFHIKYGINILFLKGRRLFNSRFQLESFNEQLDNITIQRLINSRHASKFKEFLNNYRHRKTGALSKLLGGTRKIDYYIAFTRSRTHSAGNVLISFRTTSGTSCIVRIKRIVFT